MPLASCEIASMFPGCDRDRFRTSGTRKLCNLHKRTLSRKPQILGHNGREIVEKASRGLVRARIGRNIMIHTARLLTCSHQRPYDAPEA
jgi:hypothetical protein